jgi:dTDP-4-dehydrorhamnose reductase
MSATRRVLITGVAGLVGRELVATAPAWAEVLGVHLNRPAPPGVTSVQQDLTDAATTGSVVEQLAPEIIVHCAYRQGSAPDTVDTTASLVAAARRTGATLVLLSTDAVFDGEHAPYAEDDVPEPVHEYGRQKLAAERLVSTLPGAVIIRTALVVGRDRHDAATRWLLEGLEAGERVTLFTDEFRTAIAVEDLAQGIWEILTLPERAGIWHLCGPERLSRVDIGRRIAAAHGVDDATVAEVPSSTFPGARPRDVSLTAQRAGRVLGVRPRRIGSLDSHDHDHH